MSDEYLAFWIELYGRKRCTVLFEQSGRIHQKQTHFEVSRCRLSIVRFRGGHVELTVLYVVLNAVHVANGTTRETMAEEE